MVLQPQNLEEVLSDHAKLAAVSSAGQDVGEGRSWMGRSPLTSPALIFWGIFEELDGIGVIFLSLKGVLFGHKWFV